MNWCKNLFWEITIFCEIVVAYVNFYIKHIQQMQVGVCLSVSKISNVSWKSLQTSFDSLNETSYDSHSWLVLLVVAYCHLFCKCVWKFFMTAFWRESIWRTSPQPFLFQSCGLEPSGNCPVEFVCKLQHIVYLCKIKAFWNQIPSFSKIMTEAPKFYRFKCRNLWLRELDQVASQAVSI